MEEAQQSSGLEHNFGQVTRPQGTQIQPSGPIQPQPRPVPPDDAPPPRRTGGAAWLGMTEWLLKHRDHLVREIEQGRETQVILWDLLLATVIPTAIYGLLTGLATGSWVRMITNPVKLPLVLFLTTCLCLPTLYIFSSYLGGRRTFAQTAALAFTSTAIFGVVLVAFAPITWFLTFTAPNSYHLHVLVNVSVLSLAGAVGVGFLHSATRQLHAMGEDYSRQSAFLWSWIVLYGLVGAQMGYLLRPFFSPTTEWVRSRTPGEESVFQAVGGVIRTVMGW